MAKNMPTFSIPKPFKIYPNWDFWFKKPSGNPAFETKKSFLTEMPVGMIRAAPRRL
jgi:hypothetical protein